MSRQAPGDGCRREQENPEYAENVRRFVHVSGDNDLLSTDPIADGQSDRTVPRNERPGTLPIVIYALKDLCGQGLISRWPEKIWDHPEFGPKLEAFLPGRGVTTREKNPFFNFVWHLTASSNAGRVGLFENVNATPPAFISELVYQFIDRSEMATSVREYAGIPKELAGV